MAKINGNYEVAYILKPELGEEAPAALVATAAWSLALFF